MPEVQPALTAGVERLGRAVKEHTPDAWRARRPTRRGCERGFTAIHNVLDEPAAMMPGAEGA
jgi:hypothetical protein